MRQLAFVIASLLLPLHAVAETCATPVDPIGATFRVSSNLKGDKHSHTFTLWRLPNRLLYEYPSIRAAHLWELGAQDHVALLRFFDTERQAIEYQPGDLASTAPDFYEGKRDLVSPSQREAMERKWQRRKRCAITEKYRLRNFDERATLIWDAQFGLPRSYVRKTNEGRWELELLDLITDPAAVSSAFTTRDNYRVTDYIDIGDNETDPFLLKMVHLGFVDSDHAH